MFQERSARSAKAPPRSSQPARASRRYPLLQPGEAHKADGEGLALQRQAEDRLLGEGGEEEEEEGREPTHERPPERGSGVAP